jgi:D-3-phosphoglycerate dehydrogenase
MARIFLTHPPDALANYYGERAIAGLKALGEVRFNSARRELSTPELIEAARGCEVIVSYRQPPGEAELFCGTPDLVAFLRCAIDIRNVDVAAASEAGILVTQASAGFIPFGCGVVDRRDDWPRPPNHGGGRVVSRRQGAERHEGSPTQRSDAGRHGLRPDRGYLSKLGLALGMRVLVSHTHVVVENPALGACRQWMIGASAALMRVDCASVIMLPRIF